MCGKEEQLFKAVIEDAQLQVCAQCGKFGKVLHQIMDTHIKEKVMQPKPQEFGFLVLDNYSQRIKQKRERLGLTQEEFAHRMNEKTSIIHQLESGHLSPSLQIAQKLKRTFGIVVIEDYQELAIEAAKEKTAEYTLGDFIKVKKR